MKGKFLLLSVVFFLVAVFLAFVPSAPVPADDSSCGMVPMKPMAPMGCKDLTPECLCSTDEKGVMHCHWEWRCVPW